jgi:hypothetical protein
MAQVERNLRQDVATDQWSSATEIREATQSHASESPSSSAEDVRSVKAVTADVRPRSPCSSILYPPEQLDRRRRRDNCLGERDR